MSNQVQEFGYGRFRAVFPIIRCLFFVGLGYIGLINMPVLVGQLFFGAVLVSSVLYLCVLLICVWKSSITLDRRNRSVTLQYMACPMHFFDILLKKRVSIPFDQICAVEEHTFGYTIYKVYTYRVYTTDSRFQFNQYWVEHMKLFDELREAAVVNQHQPSSIQHRERIAKRVFVGACALVFIASAIYFYGFLM